MVLLLPLLEPVVPVTTSAYTSTNTCTPPAVNTPTEWHNTQQDLSASIWHKFHQQEKEAADTPDDGPTEEWDWDIEHEDRKKESEHDKSRDHLGEAVFQVDRSLLRSLLSEILNVPVTRISFLSSGTFHKAYLIRLKTRRASQPREVIARVARRFMPRLKTESEVSTMAFLRERTNIPVPEVIYYDSNPWNRLGGEFIIMTKAPGIPLSKVYHLLPYATLLKLMDELARLLIPLFEHRFERLGSLYFGPSPETNLLTNVGVEDTPKVPPSMQSRSSTSTVRPAYSSHDSSSRRGTLVDPYDAPPFTPTLLSRAPSGHSTPKPPGALSRTSSLFGMTPMEAFSEHPAPCEPNQLLTLADQSYHVGPIISWPFFGSNRGFLSKSDGVDRGPYATFDEYVTACQQREITGVIREGEGSSAPHRLHLDPAEVSASRHHRLKALPGDESDDSDEYDGVSESEDEWEGPGDLMYRDYRRMQRTTFLVSQLQERENRVREEMDRFGVLVGGLRDILESKIEKERNLRAKKFGLGTPPARTKELFGLDCHDLSLENVFVDEKDNWKISCIIDWESTTTRPLWACAHLPAFLQSSPFTAKLFINAVEKLLTPSSGNEQSKRLAHLTNDWLAYEALGTRLRTMHRFIEWDGWEEGLAEEILGAEDEQDGWFIGLNSDDELEMSGRKKKTGRKVETPGGGEDGDDEGCGEDSPAVEGLMSPDPQDQDQEGVGLGPSIERRESPTRGSANRISATGFGNGKKKTHGKKTSLQAAPLPKLVKEALGEGKEQVLDGTGDICGGRGGELGRRLEAWLHHSGVGPDGEEVSQED